MLKKLGVLFLILCERLKTDTWEERSKLVGEHFLIVLVESLLMFAQMQG